MSRKVLTRLLGIPRDRLAQRRQAFELDLVAQLPQETHAQAPAVEIAGALEEMHFEQRLRHGVYRRPQADAGHCGTECFYLDYVYSREGRSLAQHDVRRREAEIVAELRAVRHAPAQRVRATEQPL